MTVAMHRIELDEDALGVAQAALGTDTPDDIVNEALRLVASARREGIREALDALAKMPPFDRDEAWR